MNNVERIEKLVLSAISERWSKAAMVAARAMSEDPKVDDRSVQQCLKSLGERGLIEIAGDITELRTSEVRRISKQGDV